MNLPIIKDSRGLDTIMEHAAHEAGHYTLIRLLRNLYRHRIQKIRIIDATVVQTYGAGGRVRARYYRRDRVVLDAASTLEEKEPALLVLLAGVAGETLWRYLYGERRVEEGVEDLGPGLAELLENARVTVKIWDSETWNEKARIEGQRKWEIFRNLPPSTPPQRTLNDIEQVRALIGDLDWEPYYLKALEVVHKNWPAVLRVAKALVGKRTINAKEAHLAFAGQG